MGFQHHFQNANEFGYGQAPHGNRRWPIQGHPYQPPPQAPGRAELGYDPERTLEQVLMEDIDDITDNSNRAQRGITGMRNENTGANPGAL